MVKIKQSSDNIGIMTLGIIWLYFAY